VEFSKVIKLRKKIAVPDEKSLHTTHKVRFFNKTTTKKSTRKKKKKLSSSIDKEEKNSLE
jgi:hypothetical protein